MGAWLKRHGEAIYGTCSGPLQGIPELRSTARSGRIYLHVLEWPATGALRLEAAPLGQVRTVRILGAADPKPLPWHLEGKEMVIPLPNEARDPLATVVVLEKA
jgi:alpha-L-fucosidase